MEAPRSGAASMESGLKRNGEAQAALVRGWFDGGFDRLTHPLHAVSPVNQRFGLLEEIQLSHYPSAVDTHRMVGRLVALIGILALAGCSASSRFGAPSTLDHGVWVRVDRPVENELMGRAATTLEGLGLQTPFGAAYEFLPNKPQFFLGVGKGTADRQALIGAVLPLFGGSEGLGEAPGDVTEGGMTFLCAPYSHTGVPGTVGTGGLASISAICTWSDGETAGFGIGVAGPSVADVVRMTADAREVAV
jgi:hypothetical protein